MTPVRTDRSNFTFVGPTVDIGDVWAEVDPEAGVVYVDWIPTETERDLIAVGKGVVRLGILRLGIHHYPMPPVSLDVRPDLRVLSHEPPAIHEPKAVDR